MTSYDTQLPEVLLLKCKPLYCELCAVKMNSALQSKMHYDGKVHDKHAKHFLQTWSQEAKVPTPKKKNANADGSSVSGSGKRKQSLKAANQEKRQNLQVTNLWCR